MTSYTARSSRVLLSAAPMEKRQQEIELSAVYSHTCAHPASDCRVCLSVGLSGTSWARFLATLISQPPQIELPPSAASVCCFHEAGQGTAGTFSPRYVCRRSSSTQTFHLKHSSCKQNTDRGETGVPVTIQIHCRSSRSSRSA